MDVLNEDHGNLFKGTDAENHVGLISNRVQYMSTLIDDILEYTKVNTENIVYEDIHLKTLLNSIIENIDFENKINLNAKDLDENIHISKIGFVQVFQNLISNSRKYTHQENIEIEIDFINNPKHYQFIYRDNGPGIEEKYWEKVFNMFETLNNDSNDNTGVGLATVKSIITRLGGEIFLQQREDGKSGVCFCFHFSKKEFLV